MTKLAKSNMVGLDKILVKVLQASFFVFLDYLLLLFNISFFLNYYLKDF